MCGSNHKYKRRMLRTRVEGGQRIASSVSCASVLVRSFYSSTVKCGCSFRSYYSSSQNKHVLIYRTPFAILITIETAKFLPFGISNMEALDRHLI